MVAQYDKGANLVSWVSDFMLGKGSIAVYYVLGGYL